MREIKFRAWDNVDKKMVVVNCLNWRYPSGLEVNNTNVSLPEHLMQFTGLTDKNGKEIYEGDILTDYVIYDTDEEGLEEMDFYVVEWDETNAKFICRFWDETVGDDFENCDISDLEVFGNIYEDKHRIKY